MFRPGTVVRYGARPSGGAQADGRRVADAKPRPLAYWKVRLASISTATTSENVGNHQWRAGPQPDGHFALRTVSLSLVQYLN